MEKIKYLYDYKGYRVRLVAEEGEYEGIIKNVCLNSKRVSLIKVELIKPKSFVFSDMLSFYPRDIKSCEILSETKEYLNGATHVSKKLYHPFGVRTGKKNFLFDDLGDSESVCTSAKDSESESEIVEEEEEEYVLELPLHLRARLPKKYSVIKEVNADFVDAIDHISNECVIGVSFEGREIGRNGRLFWIGISTRVQTFLFDMKALEKRAFTCGLKGIMESVGILKVIHDCRQPSDSLKHQYDTVLKNVFDTQLADAFVTMQYTGEISESVRCLYTCAKSYLNLDMKDIYISKNTKSNIPDWEFKLLRNEVLDRYIKNVIYLRLLRDELVDHMMKPLYDATNVFLNVVRNSSEKELQLLKPSVAHLMPKSLLSAGLQVLQIKSFGKDSWSNGNVNSHQLNIMDQCFEAARRLVPTKPQKKTETAVASCEKTNVLDANKLETREVSNQETKIDTKKLKSIVHRSLTLKKFLKDQNIYVSHSEEEERSTIGGSENTAEVGKSQETRPVSKSRKTRVVGNSLDESSDSSPDDSAGSMSQTRTVASSAGGPKSRKRFQKTRRSQNSVRASSGSSAEQRTISSSSYKTSDIVNGGVATDSSKPCNKVTINESSYDELTAKSNSGFCQDQPRKWSDFSENRDLSRFKFVPAGMNL